MSEYMWNYNTNMSSAQYSVPIQDDHVSNSNINTHYEKHYLYQNSPYLYAEQWPHYHTAQNISYQQIDQHSSPVTYYGWQQNSTTDWNNCYSNVELKSGKEETHKENESSGVEVATCRSQCQSQPSKRQARVHISFVNGTNGYTPVIKRKRTRTAFTTSQIEVLEKQFRKRPYVSAEERRVLTQKLQVSDKVVKVWFQNRRLKEKREKDESCSSNSPNLVNDLHVSSSDGSAEESLVNDTVSELFSVIEQVISDDLKSGMSVDNSVKTDVTYDPVSPPEFRQELDTNFEPVDHLIAFQNVMHCSNN